MDHWPSRAGGLREVVRVLRAEGLFAVVKDGGLPGSPKARSEVASLCEKQGLREVRCNDIRKGDVRFAFWLFEKRAVTG